MVRQMPKRASAKKSGGKQMHSKKRLRG